MLLFYYHCHKSSPQNPLISEIQKAQKLEPFSGGSCNERSGNLKELMILLSFQPRAIMKLFYERAAVPIIPIIPFSCTAGAGKHGGTLVLCPGKGHSPGGFRGLCLEPGTAMGLEQELLSQSTTEFIQACGILCSPCPHSKCFLQTSLGLQ